MADEVKKYLDYEGLKHLVEKLTDRIQAAGSGSAVEDGVYVCCWTNGNVLLPAVVSADEYDGEGSYALPLVVAHGRAFLIALDDIPSTYSWCDDELESRDTGGYMTTSSVNARYDFDGRENTRLFMDAAAEENVGGVPRKCHEYSTSYVGAGKWWLPSVGEMFMIYQLYKEINAALAKIDGATKLGSLYWTSTQRTKDRVWYMDFYEDVDSGMFTYTYKTDGDESCCARPIAEFVWLDGQTGGEVTSDPEPDDWGVAPKGVYVAYVTAGGRRRLIDPSGWDASLGEAQGVLVSDGESQLLFGSKQEYLYFDDSADEEYEGATVAEDEDALVADFDGMANTEAIAAVLRGNFGDDDDSHLATWCLNYATGAIGAGKWWMPSGGEANLIPRATGDDLERFLDALNAIGDGRYSGWSFWMCLSTPKGAGSVWEMTNGGWITVGTSTQQATTPVTGFSGKIVNV